MGSAWLQGGPGWQAHRCCLPHKHSTAFHDQHRHFLLNVLCHPLPTPCSRRAPSDHHTHFPFRLQLSPVSPSLSPPTFKLRVPPTLLPGTEASTTPQHCAHRAGLGEKKVKLTIKLPQAPGQPAVVTSLCSLHSRPGWLAGNTTGTGFYLNGCSLESRSCCWLALPLQEAETPETSGSGSAQAELLG